MKRLVTCLMALVPLTTLAHEGHGETGGYTIIHYFSEPVHMSITVVVLATAAYLVYRKLRKGKAKRA